MVAARWLLCMALCALALAAGVRSDDPDQCGLYNSDCSAYGSGKISVRSSFKRLFVPCCCCCFCCIHSTVICFPNDFIHLPTRSLTLCVCMYVGVCVVWLSLPLLLFDFFSPPCPSFSSLLPPFLRLLLLLLLLLPVFVLVLFWFCFVFVCFFSLPFSRASC